MTQRAERSGSAAGIRAGGRPERRARSSAAAPVICIVTPMQLVNNPRVVKEADALSDAGFDVRVVFAERGSSTEIERDEKLVRTRKWRALPVRAAHREREWLRWAVAGARERALGALPRVTWRYSRVAEHAESALFPRLASTAYDQRAELYIGHYVAGLAAAAAAARRRGARLGFDAEDFHTGEPNAAAQVARSDFLQRRYLPSCDQTTAAAAGIGEALTQAYGVQRPLTIHNTFPWADRATLGAGDQHDRRGPSLSLYWYSQVIGLDRGIQDAIRAAGLLGGPVQIHLRGRIGEGERGALRRLAEECGVADHLFVHPPVAPDALLARAEEHDVGLALEQGAVLNRAICATNKLFLYMLAGLAVAATNVPGQATVLSQHLGVGGMYRPGDHRALAALLERWRADRGQLQSAKRAALDAARETWNWEAESRKLVRRVCETLAAPPAIRSLGAR